MRDDAKQRCERNIEEALRIFQEETGDQISSVAIVGGDPEFAAYDVAIKTVCRHPISTPYAGENVRQCAICYRVFAVSKADRGEARQ